jgi:hypothetical protein
VLQEVAAFQKVWVKAATFLGMRLARRLEHAHGWAADADAQMFSRQGKLFQRVSQQRVQPARRSVRR